MASAGHTVWSRVDQAETNHQFGLSVYQNTKASMQTTMSSFLHVPPPPTHFVLRSSDAVFKNCTPPSDVIFVTKANIRIGVEVVTLMLHREGTVGTLHVMQPSVRDVSVLVSMLQKAVRRGLPELAASVALELSHVDVLSLARRLPIISVEDVDGSETSLTHSVWLSLAYHSGYQVYSEDVLWLIEYARSLATSMSHNPNFRSGHVPSIVSIWKRACKEEDSRALALVCRAAYGGMNGDVDMLLRAACDTRTSTPLFTVCSFSTIPPRLMMSHSLLEAVDFHCEPGMLQSLANRHGVEPLLIKEAIWHNSSKRNVRERGRRSTRVRFVESHQT